MLTLIMCHNRFSENENEAVEAHVPQHRDSKTKKPRHRDSKTKKPRHRETETINPRHRDSKTFFLRTKSHDIENSKAEKPRHRGPKASSFRGILTLMPPDTKRWLGTMSILHKKISGGYVAIKVGLMGNCPSYRHYNSLL